MNSKWLVSAALAMLGLGMTAQAQQPVVIPLDDRMFEIPVPPPMRAPKKEKVAYLGVSTVPSDPTLRQQLKLPRGIGLTAVMVEPSGPAAAAGLKEHDVLHKLDDQLLVSAHQLGVLVRMHKPGDTVDLTVIRAGDTQKISVKLIEKEMFVSDDPRPFDPEWDVLKHVGREGMVVAPPNGAVAVATANGESQVEWSDPQHSLRLTTRDGKKHLLAKDHEGKELFNGPVDTEEQRKALPPELREKLARVEDSAQITIRFEAGGPTSRPAPRVKIIQRRIEE